MREQSGLEGLTEKVRFISSNSKCNSLKLLDWAVASGGSAIHAVRAAIPAIIRTATSGAASSAGTSLFITVISGFLGSQGSQFLSFVYQRAVGSGGSTVQAVRAAIPAYIGTATSVTASSITVITLLGINFAKLGRGGVGDCQEDCKGEDDLHVQACCDQLKSPILVSVHL